MDPRMESFLFTASFVGAAMCVGFAYELGRSSVGQARSGLAYPTRTPAQWEVFAAGNPSPDDEEKSTDMGD